MKPSLKDISAMMLRAGALLAGSAQAQSGSGSMTSSDWWPSASTAYIGLNGGRSEFAQGHGDAYSLYVGGMANPFWGLELGATDFGRGSRSEAYGLHLSAVGRLPLNESIAVFGKLGLMYSRSDTNGARDSGFGETYGLGLDWSVNRQWAAVLQYDQTAVHFVSGRDRMNMTSIGPRYRY